MLKTKNDRLAAYFLKYIFCQQGLRTTIINKDFMFNNNNLCHVLLLKTIIIR